MTLRSATVCTIALLWLTLTAASASADSVLYDNGPQGADVGAWRISAGYEVGDTFTLTASASLGGFQFWAWLLPGDRVSSVELSITSDAFGGTTYFDQVVSFTALRCDVNAYGYDVCDEATSFNGPHLGAGTYWLNLQNAMTPNGDDVLWDENDGVLCDSPGCPSLAAQNTIGTIASESFTVLGTAAGSTPEPGTLLLLGSGLVVFFKLGRDRWR